ncbi:MAG: 50S ribosomal protein L3 N(5)-glutamine methyltransferase [Steroidobacteraceae bacterium]
MSQLIERTRRRLASARLHYGHGTADAADDAAALVVHACALKWPLTDAQLARRPGLKARAHLDVLVRRRIVERVPAVYLTGLTFFAGLPMRTDARALVPRSPIAELVEQQFQPFIDPSRVKSVLDVGTGSGCIAIACAYAFPKARVDAVDISDEALSLARENRRDHRLTRRLRLVESDYFSALEGRRYDIIVSNPPYVGSAEFNALPPEFAHEPALGLKSGRDGLDAVKVLLAQARDHLRPGGLLVVEVGNTEAAVRRRWRRVPFTWLGFERGGGGVFLLTAEALDSMIEG